MMAGKLPAVVAVASIGVIVLSILINDHVVLGDSSWNETSLTTTAKTMEAQPSKRRSSARNAYKYKQGLQYLYRFRPLITDKSSNRLMSWSSWSPCSFGFQTKYLSGCNLYERSGCMQRRRCETDTKPGTNLVPPLTWSTWSNCVKGYRTRSGRPCKNFVSPGNCVERAPCKDPVNQWTSWNSINTQWSSWTSWNSINAQWSSWSSCANSYKRRRRLCNTPQSDNVCEETLFCEDMTTTLRPQWGGWSSLQSPWGSWSKCNNGVRTRRRKCTYGENNNSCFQTQRCNIDPGSWTPWTSPVPPSSWGRWSSCVNRARTRRRQCIYGENEKSCVQTESCSITPEPGDIRTTALPPSPWGRWSRCMDGERTRKRPCSNGSCFQTEKCNTIPQPQDLRTTAMPPSPWGRWSSCVNEKRSRRRMYNYGSFFQTEKCNTTPQPENLHTTAMSPSPWGRWSHCVEGERTRRRWCNYDENRNSCFQRESCNITPEPWSSWTTPSAPSTWESWSECMNGIRIRTRPCDNEINRGACIQRQACYTTPSSNQQWTSWATPPSTWQPWTECVNGYRERERYCDARYNTNTCQERKRCNENPEAWTSWTSPSPPSEWGSWSTCVNGARTRSRCNHGENWSSCVQRERCHRNPESWTSWTSSTDSPSTWGPWSACYYGTMTRKRSCASEGNNDECLEQVRCEASTAPPNSWNQWSACVNGYKMRTYECMNNSMSSRCQRRQRLNC